MTKRREDSYLAIGDIHGCWRELERLVRKLGTKYDLEHPDVRLTFLGDYIDRGDSSMKVLEILRDLKKCFPQTILLRGNHEQHWLDGGHAENDIPDPAPEWVRKLLDSTMLWHETKHFLFIHGGPLDSTASLESQDSRELLWNYSPGPEGWRGKTVVKGHTVVTKPHIWGRVAFLDTGCFMGRTLTCGVFHGTEGSLIETVQEQRPITPLGEQTCDLTLMLERK